MDLVKGWPIVYEISKLYFLSYDGHRLIIWCKNRELGLPWLGHELKHAQLLGKYLKRLPSVNLRTSKMFNHARTI